MHPRQRLVLPFPKSPIVQSLNRALVDAEAMDLVPKRLLRVHVNPAASGMAQRRNDARIPATHSEKNPKVAYVNIAVSKASPPTTPNIDYALVRHMHPELDMFA